MATPLDSLVVDLSNYDWDTFNAKAFYDAGVRRAIVGSQQPSVCGPMVDALRSEGIEVIATYDLPYFGSDGTAHGPIERAVSFAAQYKIPHVWVDAEIDANQTNVTQWKSIPTPSVAQRQAEFRWCMNLVKQNVASGGVYSAPWFWVPQMGNSTEWASSPLWLANYGQNDGKQPPITTTSFGGWTTVALHQYTSTYVINGRGRDMSYQFAATGVEDELSQADIDRITALESGQTGLLKSIVDLQFALFSGNEDRDHTMAQRVADVAYRIDQRLGRASDGTKMNSVSDNAWAALNAVQALAAAAGVSEDKVKTILGTELSAMLDAAKASIQ